MELREAAGVELRHSKWRDCVPGCYIPVAVIAIYQVHHEFLTVSGEVW